MHYILLLFKVLFATEMVIVQCFYEPKFHCGKIFDAIQLCSTPSTASLA